MNKYDNCVSLSDSLSLHMHMWAHLIVHIGLARTIYMRCVYGIFGREITKYTVICGVHLYTYGFGQPYAHPHVHAHTHQKLHYTNFITVYYTHVCMCALEGGRVSCLSITSTTSTALKTHCRDIALKQHLQRTP
jgi:hypothetical protein